MSIKSINLTVCTIGFDFAVRLCYKRNGGQILKEQTIGNGCLYGGKLDRILSELNLYTIHDGIFIVAPACHIFFGTKEQKSL